MASNRLNLQIGGPGPEEYAKRKVMREVQGLNEEIDAVVAQFIEEEERQVEYISEEAPIVQEKQPTRQERLAESLTLYNTKTNQSLQEVSPFSDGERIKLLEDAFAQMKRGQPQTLVSGIGASLDSGGGAVWLWDLDDVNIGTPMNGVYPSVTDGAFLAYNAAAKAWQAVEDASSANALSGAVIKATGGAANASGNLVIEATDATDGNFTIKNASAVEKFVIDGSTGDTTLSGGKLLVKRGGGSIGSSAFQIQGRTVDLPQDNTSVLFTTYQSHPSDLTSDTVRYYGKVVDDNDITTKEYVDDAVASASPGGNFDFKGTTDVTGTPPSNPSGGDFYINIVAGTATNAWTGIAGFTIAEDQLVLYSSTNSRWFAGSIEGANPNVLKTGDTMVGALTIDIPSDAGSSAALLIKQDGVTKAEIFSGGAATFNNTVTTQNILPYSVKPRTDDTYLLGDASKSWKAAHINTLNTTEVVNTGTLDVSGTTQLGKATAGTRILLGNTSMVGSTSNPTYFIEGGASANLVIDRCNDNSMSIPQIVIQGKVGTDGVKTSNLLEVFRLTGNNPDAIRYFGRTTSNDDIQTKTSALGLITDGGWSVTGNVSFSGDIGSTGSNSWAGDNDFASTKTVTFNGTTVIRGELNNGTNGHILLNRPTSSTTWFKIIGRNQAGGSTTNILFDVEKGAGNAVDKVVYYGDTTSDASEIQTKASVEALIAAQTSAWTTINTSTMGQSSSTMTGTAWYIKYRTTNGGTTVEVQVHAAKNGSPVTNGDIVGVMPSALHPTKEFAILFSPKNASSSLSQGYGSWGVMATTGAIAITQVLVDNPEYVSNSSGIPGSQDYWANFSYTLG